MQYFRILKTWKKLNELSWQMKVEFVDLKSKEEHEKFQHVIAELMNEATKRTKEEVDALKKMYNANLEKLIEECGFLENVNILESDYLNDV